MLPFQGVHMVWFWMASAFADPAWPPMEERSRTVEGSVVLPFPAARVWEVVAVNYGEISSSNPRIFHSEGPTGALGAERVCDFSPKEGRKRLHEQIVGFDPVGMVMHNRVLEAVGVPLDPENGIGIYTVRPIDAGHAELSVRVDFRTRPAWMGPLAQGRFQTFLDDYLEGVSDFLESGTAVAHR